MQRVIGPGGSAPRLVACVLVISACSLSVRAAAQDAQERRAAAEAYDRGTSAWLAGNYEQAAALFETAHRLAPASEALVQAVRSHQRAGNGLRAATVALRLQELYDDERAQRLASKLLDKAHREYALVEVECEGCTIDLDGTILEHPSFFVEPDVEHSVTASFPHGDRSETVSPAPGETVELSFEAPPPPPEGEGGGDGGSGTEGGGAGGGAGGGGPGGRPVDAEGEPLLTPWVPIAFGVATAGAGAALVWSGLDTLDANDRYEEMPTPDRLEDGQDREKRTNILIGVTAGLGAVTAVTTILAALRKDPEPPETRATIAPTRGGGVAVVEGRF